MDEKQILQDITFAGCNISSSILYLSIKHEQMSRKYGKEADIVKQFSFIIENLQSYDRSYQRIELDFKVQQMKINKQTKQIAEFQIETRKQKAMIERLKEGI